jgi:hypothetical protein
MNLPLLFQNVSSSGFQSEIQVLLCSPIGEFSLLAVAAAPRRRAPLTNQKAADRRARALGASLLSAALLLRSVVGPSTPLLADGVDSGEISIQASCQSRIFADY